MATILKYRPEPKEGYRHEKIKCLKCYGVQHYMSTYGMKACEECYNGFVWREVKTRNRKHKVVDKPLDQFETKFPNNEKTKIVAELLPCPFCGSDAELSGCFPYGQYYIKCTECRVSLWHDRKDKAIGAWNTRT